MLKYELKYTDYDGAHQETTLWFHISKTSLMLDEQNSLEKIMDFGEELKRITPELEEVEKSQTDSFEEKKTMVNAAKIMAQMLNEIVDLSYGLRDGKRFQRSPEILKAFKESQEYEEFVMELLSNPEKMLFFIKSLTAQIEK